MPGAQDGTVDPGLDGEIATSGNQDKWVGRDAYAYHLGFYEGDYFPINPNIPMGVAENAWNQPVGDVNILSLSGVAGLFNGNIPLMITDLKKPTTNYSFFGGALLEAYQYDQLNRIKQQRTYHRGSTGWTRTSSGLGLYDSRYDYDRNGNIESLRRRVPDVSAGSWNNTFLMDDLVYSYPLTLGEKTHNRLQSVADLEPVHSGIMNDYQGTSFTYDAIGNIVSDATEYISNIRWDLQGKVREVTRAANPNNLPGLAFWYDGTGNRVHKRVTTPGAAGGPDIVRDGLAVF